jgi:hypothetical protein
MPKKSAVNQTLCCVTSKQKISGENLALEKKCRKSDPGLRMQKQAKKRAVNKTLCCVRQTSRQTISGEKITL